MNLSPVFKNLCLRVGRAIGVVAEREVSVAPAVHIAQDVLTLENRRLTPQKVHAAAMSKAVSPLVALEPRLRSIIDGALPLDFYAEGRCQDLLMGGNRKFEAINDIVVRIPGWGDDPILKRIQALAKDGHSESPVNLLRTRDGASRNQWQQLQAIKKLLD